MNPERDLQLAAELSENQEKLPAIQLKKMRSLLVILGLVIAIDIPGKMCHRSDISISHTYNVSYRIFYMMYACY